MIDPRDIGATVTDASQNPITAKDDEGHQILLLDGHGLTFSTFDQPVVVASWPTHNPVQTSGIAVDSAGSSYAVDLGNIVRKFAPSGAEVTTGGFPLTTAGPAFALALDSAGNLVVVGGNTVAKYTSAGVQVTSGSWPYTGGTLLEGVTVFGGNVFTVDRNSGKIQKFNLTTGAQVVTGGWPVSTGDALVDIAATSTALLVNDDDTTQIRKFDPATGAEDTTGNWPVSYTGFAKGLAVAADDSFYLAKLDGTGIQIYAADGTPGAFISLAGDVRSLTFDADGFLYAGGSSTNLIDKISVSGTLTVTFQIDQATGRVIASDARIKGRLNTDTITSDNGLTILGPVRASGLDYSGKAQSGTGVVATTAAATQSVAVVFPTEFPTAPTVTLDVISTTPNLFQSSHSVATTTGFTIYLYRASGSGNVSVDWQAIAP